MRFFYTSLKWTAVLVLAWSTFWITRVVMELNADPAVEAYIQEREQRAVRKDRATRGCANE